MIYEIKDHEIHSPRVTRKRRARMQRILAAALDVAREEGRDALTLQRVAERLDVTPAALYRYFASKDALVAELQRSVITWLAEATVERIEAASDYAAEFAPGDRALLDVVITALTFEHFASTAPIEFGLLSMYLSTPEFALPQREAAQVFNAAWNSLDGLAQRIDTASDHDALSPGSATGRALALYAGLQGAAQTNKLMRSAPDRIDPTRIALDLVRSLLVGWGADAGLVDRFAADARSHGFTDPKGSVDDLLEAAGA